MLLLLVLVAAVRASEPPLEACSGNGIFYPDVGACDCFQCFGGNACATVNASCIIKDLAGSPRLFQEVFWAVPEHMHKAEAILAPWYRNPYVECMGHCQISPGGPVVGIQIALKQAILGIHEAVGNVKTEGKTIVYAHGATELIMAAQWAQMQLKGSATAFAQTPYYDGYPTPSTAGFSGLQFSAATNLSASDNIIEMLAFPNNPDGAFRSPFYNESSTRVIHDMVYYWPHLIPESQGAQLDFDVMFFSMSKLSGHAGSRFGWALVQDAVFAAKMQEWIAKNSIHVSVDSSHRAFIILQHLADPSFGPTFFSTMRNAFENRWALLEEQFFNQTTRFTQLSRRGTFYPWVRCNRPTEKDCAAVFASVGIEVIPGTAYGAGSEYVRMEMVQYSPVFELMLKRLSKLIQ